VHSPLFGTGAGCRIPAILAALCLCLMGGTGMVRAADEHLRLEVELVEEGVRSETRVADLDLCGTGKPENDDWTGFLLALGSGGRDHSSF